MSLDRDTPSTRASKAEKHLRRLNRSPCNRPPARPDPPIVTFRVREAKTHLEFTGKIKWPEMELDSSGFPVTVTDYALQYQARDAGGDLVDLEDGKSRIRYKRKSPPAMVRLRSAEIVATDVAEFVTHREHNLEVGDKFQVKGCTPTAYNGEWTATDVPNDTTVRANIGANPAEATTLGRVLDAMDSFHVIIEHVPRPKSYRWEARLKGRSSEGCWSRWSAWSTPVLPWSGADPEPPAPDILSLDFDRKGGKKHNPWRGKLRLDPVRFWDVPGGDTEDDLSRYFWRIEVSEDAGSTWDTHTKGVVEDQDDEDGDDIIKVVFGKIRRRNRYRAFAGGVDRFGRRGDPTGPYPSANGTAVSDTVDDVGGITVKHVGPLEWRVRWNEPADSSDVDRYRVDVFVGGSFYESVYTRAQHLHYKGDAANKGTAHRFDVFSIDEDGNDSSGLASSSQPDTATIPGSYITPGTIDITPLASSIRPVIVVSSLPTLPDSAYTAGTYVYLTTDGQLYVTKNGTSWVRAVTAVDLAGQITGTQITDSAITAPKISANTITADEIAANAITSNELAANSVIAGKIAAAAVSASEISVSTLSAISAAMGTLTSGVITGGQIFASLFSTDTSGGSGSNIIEIDGDAAKDSVVFVGASGESGLKAVSNGIQVGRNASTEKVGFYGATPVLRPTITGSRGGNAALADLLQGMNLLGIINNNTSA